VNRYVVVLATVVASLGLVTGCGSASPDAQRSTTPASTTQDPGPSQETTQWVEEYIAAAGQVTTGHIVVHQDFVSGGETASTHMDVDMDGTDRYCEGTALDYPFVAVIVGDTAYLQDYENGWQEMPRSLLSVSEIHINPAATIAAQRVAITKVELVGSEDVNGVATDHYVITYDAAKRTDLPFGVAYESVLLGDWIIADIWVDEQMRPVRYESTMLARKDMASGRSVLEAVYSDYGKPVTIEAPQLSTPAAPG